jgi:hypothetical protein
VKIAVIILQFTPVDESGKRSNFRWIGNSSSQTSPGFLMSSRETGGATLFRSKQRVEMRVATSGLNMNSSYTVWWVVFNNPAGCIGGCAVKDLSNPAARPSVLYAAGFVTGLGDNWQRYGASGCRRAS